MICRSMVPVVMVFVLDINKGCVAIDPSPVVPGPFVGADDVISAREESNRYLLDVFKRFERSHKLAINLVW